MKEVVNEFLSNYEWTAEKYIDFLQKAATCLKKYSPRNRLLIYIQNPKFTDVRSFMKWEKAGRRVTRQARGIYIIEPYRVDKKIGKSEEIITRIKFKKVISFDISQTLGNVDIAPAFSMQIEREKLFIMLCEIYKCKVLYRRLQDERFGFFSDIENAYILNLEKNSDELFATFLFLLFEKIFIEKDKNQIASMAQYFLFAFDFSSSKSLLEQIKIDLKNFDSSNIQVFTTDILKCSDQLVHQAREKVFEKDNSSGNSVLTLSQKIQAATLATNAMERSIF